MEPAGNGISSLTLHAHSLSLSSRNISRGLQNGGIVSQFRPGFHEMGRSKKETFPVFLSLESPRDFGRLRRRQSLSGKPKLDLQQKEENSRGILEMSEGYNFRRVSIFFCV